MSAEGVKRQIFSLQVHPKPSTFADHAHWSNRVSEIAGVSRTVTEYSRCCFCVRDFKDMDPTPEGKRVWTLWSYTSMWISDAFNVPAVSIYFSDFRRWCVSQR